MDYHKDLQQAARENNRLALKILNADNMRHAVFMVAYEYAKFIEGVDVYDDDGKRNDEVIYESFAKVAHIEPKNLKVLCRFGKITKSDFAHLCFFGLGIHFKSELVQDWFRWRIIDDDVNGYVDDDELDWQTGNGS